MCQSTSCEVGFVAYLTMLLALPLWIVAGLIAAAASRSLRRIRPHLLALPFALIGAMLFLLGSGVSDKLPLSVRFSRWELVVEGVLAAVPIVAWYLSAARRARTAIQPGIEPAGPSAHGLTP